MGLIQRGGFVKHLRLIVDRQEEKPHPTDLRGLGTTPLLQEAFPFVALSLHKVPEPLIERLIRSTTLELTLHRTHGNVFLREKSPKESEHKIQAVHLFSAVLKMSSHMPKGARVCLFEVSPLRYLLEQGIRYRKPPTSDHRDHAMLSSFFELHDDHRGSHQHFCAVSPACSWYLKQAGFAIVTRESEPIFFSQSDVLSVLEKTLEQMRREEDHSPNSMLAKKMA